MIIIYVPRMIWWPLMVIPTLLQHKASLYRFVSDGVHSKVTYSAKKNKHMPFKFKVTILNHCLKLNEYHCFFFSSDSKVFCLGLIQSLFEGSMYTFVLEWTPALTPSKLVSSHI